MRDFTTMSFRRLLLAASAIALAAPAAQAQGLFRSPDAAGVPPVTGLYIAGGAGWNHQNERSLGAYGGGPLGNRSYFQNTVRTTPGGVVDFDEGFVGVASLGWGFGNGIRAEIEGNFRYNDVDRIGGFGGGSVTRTFRDNGGRVRQYGVMGNAFYDFRIPGANIVPYVGGGVGYLWTEFDGVAGTRNTATGNRIRIDDTDGRFAYQGIAGAAIPVAFAPGLAFTLEYRYLGTLEQKFDGEVRSPTGALVSRGYFKAGNSGNHSILFGARYAFNQPRPAVAAPAPVPAQAPAPARTYLVFFDWDRADLTDRARQIVAEAATNARRTQVTRIEVAGHADRSGTPQYNQRLSQRRAEAVAAELARNGVSRNDISIQAFGESRPLVPTADGVREPQNRRVEIVLR